MIIVEQIRKYPKTSNLKLIKGSEKFIKLNRRDFFQSINVEITFSEFLPFSENKIKHPPTIVGK